MQRGEENRPGGRRRSCNAVEGFAGQSISVAICSSSFPLFSVCLLSFNLCNLRPSLYWLSALSSPLFCRFYLQKIEQPEGSPCFFSCFSSLFSSFSSTTCLPDLTITQEMKGRNSLCSLHFLSLLLPASLAFFSGLSFLLFFLLPLARSLEGAYIQSNISLFRKDSMH